MAAFFGVGDLEVGAVVSELLLRIRKTFELLHGKVIAGFKIVGLVTANQNEGVKIVIHALKHNPYRGLGESDLLGLSRDIF